VYDFDVLVIGSGPGGQKAAIAAAKLDRRVAIVERQHMIGGVCLNTGTIPSKTLREAILYLTGLDQREMYGASYRVKDEITIADLAARTTHVVGRETEVVRSQLTRNRVTILTGSARFTGTGATELVHIGQAVMGCGGTIDYLVDAVFNYPTLAEAYKVAALDAMNKMRQIERFS
jgi:pyruvate/2-oxoglutarate dehydrogenase complex dihydrolipoamide dehydrogenase (E3) component